MVKQALEEKPVTIDKGSYIEIDFSREFKEKNDDIFSTFRKQDVNFYTMLKLFDEIEKDENVKGVVLKLDNILLNRGQIEEIGKKIDNLKKSQKEVYSYMNMADNRNYLLALKSDQIFMPPSMSASVNITGYYNEMMYYKLLLDKLGIKVNVIHVGDYKSYGEEYTKEYMSSEYRENMERLLNKIYDNFVKNISEERKLNFDLINERILTGDLMGSEPHQLQKLGMIDEFIYYDQLKMVIGENKLVPIEKYNQNINRNSILVNKNSRDKLAIIYAEGTIIMGGEESIPVGKIQPSTLISELDKAAKDKSIKGIVLRVNSPGGSALASDLISHKVAEVNKIKPVYVSIGGVAASGGYYISSNAEKIFTDKESLTGSIGVVSLIPTINELMGKVSINTEEIKKGKYADLYSLTKEMDKDREEKIYGMSLKIYSEFVDVVAEGRNLDREDVEKIAQGKVWLGEEAVEIGLADEIGGLENTIEALATKLNLENYEVTEIIEMPGYDTVLKRYIPSMKLMEKIESISIDKELYFKPILYFPYDI